MTSAQVIEAVKAAGVNLVVSATGAIKAIGDADAVNRWLPEIREHKTEIIEELQIEMIQAWLFRIGEPEDYHFVVIDKCRSNPEAMQYFLKHANGEFETEQ